ncbi:MAG: hypothetical protein AB7P22_06480 [Vicinamibacterales bacterium]
MHTILKQWFSVALVALAISCGGEAPSSDASSASSAASSATAPVSTAASDGRLDMDAIFPPGPGRDLVLNNCQNCHTFVPIVVLQMDKAAWQRNSIDHRERVTTLTDEEFKTLYEYLTANFNPDRPVPELPQDLLESWTSY